MPVRHQKSPAAMQSDLSELVYSEDYEILTREGLSLHAFQVRISTFGANELRRIHAVTGVCSSAEFYPLFLLVRSFPLLSGECRVDTGRGPSICRPITACTSNGSDPHISTSTDAST